jgi:hypothetical protein
MDAQLNTLKFDKNLKLIMGNAKSVSPKLDVNRSSADSFLLLLGGGGGGGPSSDNR